MGWLIVIGCGLLNAVACGALALWLATMAVGWYRVSSFEGQAGYFVVFLGLGGIIGGLVIGLVAAGIARSQDASGLATLGISTGAAVGLTLAIGGVARALADIPPTIDGRGLDLVVEFRLPPDAVDRPALPEGETSVELLSLRRGRAVRGRSDLGVVEADGVRREDGRWVVPTRMFVFTERGDRIVSVRLGEHKEGFAVPLPARPGPKHEGWSDWLPRPRPDGGPATNKLTYRFRVEQRPE